MGIILIIFYLLIGFALFLVLISSNILKNRIKDRFDNFLSTLFLFLVTVVILPILLFVLTPYFLKLYGDVANIKSDYQRQIDVNFEYKNKQYLISANIKCINTGRSINFGSMQWYKAWGMEIASDKIFIDGDELVLAFYSGLSDSIAQKAEKEIKGYSNPYCEILFNSEDSIKKIGDDIHKYIDLSFKSDFMKLNKNRKSRSIKILSHKIYSKKTLIN
jgi:hypothetical protein